VTLAELEGSRSWNFSDRNPGDVSTGQTIPSEAQSTRKDNSLGD